MTRLRQRPVRVWPGRRPTTASGVELDAVEAETVDYHAQALAAFEAIGDRAEEGRILSELAWTHPGGEHTMLAPRKFLDSAQA